MKVLLRLCEARHRVALDLRSLGNLERSERFAKEAQLMRLMRCVTLSRIRADKEVKTYVKKRAFFPTTNATWRLPAFVHN